MSQTDPFTFVQRTFPPTVGCLSSYTVEQICQKNNLSFVELIRPFCLVNVDYRLRDPSGNDHPIQKLLLSIQDVYDRPPQPSLAKKFLNESVSNLTCDNTKAVEIGSFSIDIPSETLWFQSWSNTFLQVQFPSTHEFTKHLLGCILVTSSVDPPETLQSLLQSLQQMQNVSPESLPKWFSSSVFKFYVLVHDAKDGDKAKALNFFNSLKTAYGPEHCYFLEINSQQQDVNSTTPDYWTNFIFKRNTDVEGSEHGSSPRTPAEISAISGMPNCVSTETEVSNKLRSSPDVGKVGAGSGVSIVIHPLSPDLDSNQSSLSIAEYTNQVPVYETPKVVNSNVWSNVHNNYQFGSFLSNADVENIKSLIRHLALQVLIPHVEKQIFYLTDLTSNKKGVSRSLLSATKRLFGTTKPGSPNSSPPNSVIYANDAPELHYRRLGDLYFMFTNYSLAFQAYHSAKRDFQADQAWKYYAGALEMAALSVFMQGEIAKKGIEYMEEAILTYLNSCKLPQFATRATLLSTLFLRERQMYGEAAKQLIRMASEDSDLRSALLLEQASYCFLFATKPNMFRKYAFHMVLAGHRFSKGGQKKHALRCYKQAFQLYKDRGWSLAEDHIHFTVGKLAGHLKLLKEGSSSLAFLLSSTSKQTPAQQETYLREFLQMLQQEALEESNKKVPLLPLPIIEDNSVVVLVSSSTSTLVRAFEPDSPADSVRWSRMEELAVTESQGPPMIFKPTILLFSKKTVNTTNPVVVVNEPLYIHFCVKNALQIALPIFRLQLLWNFIDESGNCISNEFGSGISESLVTTHVLEWIQLEPSSTQLVTLSLIPHRSGQINILGVLYCLSFSPSISSANVHHTDTTEVSGKQIFVVKGQKLRSKPEGNSVSFEKDKRLEIKIIESAPLLSINMDKNICPEMLCGEIQEVRIKLHNTGNSHLTNLFMVTNSSRLISLAQSFVENEKTLNEPSITEDTLNEYNVIRDKTNSYKIIKISLKENGILKSGEEIILPLWIRAPERKGVTQLKILFYYENADGVVGLKHRVSRCSFEINVCRSIQYSAEVSRSTLCEDRDTMNINVTVQNLNHPSDDFVAVISLVQMSLASNKWKLQEKAVLSTELTLKSQEKYYFLVRADRLANEGSFVSDVSFDGQPIISGNSQPYFDFYKWDFNNDKEQNDSSNFFSLPLYLRWSAKIINNNADPKIVYGQSLVILNQLGVAKHWPPEPLGELATSDNAKTFKIFGPERKMSLNQNKLKSVYLENALSYNLVHESNVVHSFRESRICRVDMKLILRNCVDYPVRVVVNAPDQKLGQSIISKTQLYTPLSSSTFSWASRSNILLKLNGNERAKIILSAVFTSPGTYDLGSRLVVAVAPEGDAEFVNQACRVQSVIIVLEKDSPCS